MDPSWQRFVHPYYIIHGVSVLGYLGIRPWLPAASPDEMFGLERVRNRDSLSYDCSHSVDGAQGCSVTYTELLLPRICDAWLVCVCLQEQQLVVMLAMACIINYIRSASVDAFLAKFLLWSKLTVLVAIWPSSRVVAAWVAVLYGGTVFPTENVEFHMTLPVAYGLLPLSGVRYSVAHASYCSTLHGTNESAPNDATRV